MENKKLIGKEIKGFEFKEEDYPEIGWVSPEMDKCIGERGIIFSYNGYIKSYEIDFGNDLVTWDYPAKLVEEHERNM